MNNFTNAFLDWAPTRALATELEVQRASGTTDDRSSPYTATLGLHSASLAARSALYDLVMYGRPGLRRPAREYIATVASMLTGCRYCVSVHARRLEQLTKRPDDVHSLLADEEAFSDMRAQGFDALAIATTTNDSTAVDAAVDQQRSVGLHDADIFDGANVAAMFAWANRLMMTLGSANSAADADPDPHDAGGQ